MPTIKNDLRSAISIIGEIVEHKGLGLGDELYNLALKFLSRMEKLEEPLVVEVVYTYPEQDKINDPVPALTHRIYKRDIEDLQMIRVFVEDSKTWIYKKERNTWSLAGIQEIPK
jgi:hypothetical protein